MKTMTCKFDLDSFGGSAVSGVMIEIDVDYDINKMLKAREIKLDENIFMTRIEVADKASKDFLISIGGEGVVTHWENKLREMLTEDSDFLIDDFIDEVPEEDFEKLESFL